MKIPIRVLKLTHILGQPCEFQVARRRARASCWPAPPAHRLEAMEAGTCLEGPSATRAPARRSRRRVPIWRTATPDPARDKPAGPRRDRNREADPGNLLRSLETGCASYGLLVPWATWLGDWAEVGLGRTVALHYSASTLYQIH